MSNTNKDIIDFSAARGLAKKLDSNDVAMLKLILADDNMKGIFLSEMDFIHAPIVNQKDDESVKLIYAMKYALGRSTSVAHTIADEIKDKWEFFTSPEKQDILEEITTAIVRNKAGHGVDKDKWQEVLDHHHNLSSDTGPKF